MEQGEGSWLESGFTALYQLQRLFGMEWNESVVMHVELESVGVEGDVR